LVQDAVEIYLTWKSNVGHGGSLQTLMSRIYDRWAPELRAAPPHPDSAREMALCCDCMFPDDCPGTSGGKCKLRFFIEHGVIHDSVTGKHVRTCDCVPGDGGGVTETCALLNELTLRSPDRAPGQGENDELVKELREAQHGWPISTAMYRLLERAATALSRADSAGTAEQKK
jgi:hypothetical protein